MNSNTSKTSCKRGFTLIELLVVVLIIGILAAVALPQYKIAVEKSRAAEALVNLRTFANAFKVYKLANGTEPSSLDKLDVSISSGSSNFFEYGLTDGNKGILATRKDKDVDMYKYLIYVNGWGSVSCVAKTEHAKPICANISGIKNGAYQNNMYYYTFPQVNFYTR